MRCLFIKPIEKSRLRAKLQQPGANGSNKPTFREKESPSNLKAAVAAYEETPMPFPLRQFDSAARRNRFNSVSKSLRYRRWRAAAYYESRRQNTINFKP